MFTHNIFPADQAENISKIYLKNIKEARAALRPLAKEVITNSIKATMDGMSAISVHDIKEGKLEEALKLQQELILAYHEIPGYKYRIEIRFKATEALGMLGMKIPE